MVLDWRKSNNGLRIHDSGLSVLFPPLRLSSVDRWYDIPSHFLSLNFYKRIDELVGTWQVAGRSVVGELWYETIDLPSTMIQQLTSGVLARDMPTV